MNVNNLFLSDWSNGKERFVEWSPHHSLARDDSEEHTVDGRRVHGNAMPNQPRGFFSVQVRQDMCDWFFSRK